MSEVRNFEDLVAWQKARLLTRTVYQITREGSFAKDFGLTGQIQRASVSVMSNIAEGFERGNRAEFRHYLNIALASCAEARSQLYVALDAGYVTSIQFEQLSAQAKEVSRILGGLRGAVTTQWNDQERQK